MKLHFLKEIDEPAIYEKDSEIFDLWLRYFDAIDRKGNLLEDCQDNQELLLLRGNIAIEYFLDEIIKNYLKNGEVLTKKFKYLSQKLQIVESFKVIDQDVVNVIKELNRIRNNCAHKLEFRISEDDLQRILSQSSTLKEQVKNSERILLQVFKLLLLELAYEAVDMLRDKKAR